MTITYNSNSVNPLLEVTATELDDFVTNIANYTEVTITATLTCSAIPIVQTYNTTDVLVNTNLFYIVAGAPNILYISPKLFGGALAFVDGIYKLSIKFTKSNGYVQINNCIFVDITYSCKLASLITNILSENASVDTNENTSTIAHILHYALNNANNCGCNCDEMCTVFNALADILTNIDPQTLSDCGCQ